MQRKDNPNESKMTSYSKAHPLSSFIRDDLDYIATLEDELFDCEESFVTRRSSISFSDNFSTQEIPCITEMDASEVAVTWYSQKDFASMKAECRELAKSVKSDRNKESAYMCIRGLEEKVNGSQKKINRSEAISAVLCEQDRQFSNGEQNPELIAQVYQEFASHCLDEAVELALRDQEAALAIRGPPSNSSTSSPSPEDHRCTPNGSGIPSFGGRRTMLVA